MEAEPENLAYVAKRAAADLGRSGKVVGKPHWGKLDVRFDEGAEEIALDVGIYPDA